MMAGRIWVELSAEWKSSYYHVTLQSRPRGHRLLRRLGGYCGRVSEERAWIKGLGREYKKAWKDFINKFNYLKCIFLRCHYLLLSFNHLHAVITVHAQVKNNINLRFSSLGSIRIF